MVTLHDFGFDSALGLDFLVMEFLQGEDLATRLKREGRPELDLATRILRDAARGIALGHRAGVVHRDVKPGNIFLAESEDGGGVRVCILDFGIARMVSEDQTLTGYPGESIPLSPAYASPEQSRGDRELTPGSDVFSLGVVGYQLLTGAKPFAAARRVQRSDWMPMSRIRELNPAVPSDIEGAVHRALAYEAADRFEDAETLVAALESAQVEDRTILVPPGAEPAPPAPQSDHTLAQPRNPVPQHERHPLVIAEPPGRRRRSLAGPLAFVLLLGMGAAGGWWYLSNDEAPTPVDRSAVRDIELVAEDVGAPAEASPAPTGESDPGLPYEVDLVPAGDALGTLSGREPAIPDTAAPDPAAPVAAESVGADLQVGAPDTAVPLPDSALPPPRVIGTPVDSPGATPNRSEDDCASGP